jgi:hypothetical protein
MDGLGSIDADKPDALARAQHQRIYDPLNIQIRRTLHLGLAD